MNFKTLPFESSIGCLFDLKLDSLRMMPVFESKKSTPDESPWITYGIVSHGHSMLQYFRTQGRGHLEVCELEQWVNFSTWVFALTLGVSFRAVNASVFFTMISWNRLNFWIVLRLHPFLRCFHLSLNVLLFQKCSRGRSLTPFEICTSCYLSIGDFVESHILSRTSRLVKERMMRIYSTILLNSSFCCFTSLWFLKSYENGPWYWYIVFCCCRTLIMSLLQENMHCILKAYHGSANYPMD